MIEFGLAVWTLYALLAGAYLGRQYLRYRHARNKFEILVKLNRRFRGGRSRKHYR
jgi:hypothetical protein